MGGKEKKGGGESYTESGLPWMFSFTLFCGDFLLLLHLIDAVKTSHLSNLLYIDCEEQGFTVIVVP